MDKIRAFLQEQSYFQLFQRRYLCMTLSQPAPLLLFYLLVGPAGEHPSSRLHRHPPAISHFNFFLSSILHYKQNFHVLYQFVTLYMARQLLLIQRVSPAQTPLLPFVSICISTGYISTWVTSQEKERRGNLYFCVHRQCLGLLSQSGEWHWEGNNDKISSLLSESWHCPLEQKTILTFTPLPYHQQS